MITTNQIRQRFLDYFIEQGHARVASAPLVPQNDPTLLFTNAGMVPFKDVFLGVEKRSYNRATSVQRCVRAGGKHNDLDNVGYTARHHTFFEMLGNFSFGDYFKREAIRFAWTFLTEVLALPAEKLWVTVFEEDHEAEQIWLNEIGVSSERFSRIGAKDNFWMMGETGPCGPCTEIFYDHGPSIPGGPPGSPDEDGDRYIEIWNLVFMQYNRDEQGNLEPLPKPSVDTGMGIERLAAILQGVHDNYHIDVFQGLIKAMAHIAGVDDLDARPLRVIADHIRSTAFLIVDGVVPSNEGRGYVLRRIMRRAIRYGHKLGVTEPFFYKLVPALVAEMGEAYPELTKAQYEVEGVIRREEEQFARTLDQGMRIFEQDVSALSGSQISGETAFKLYDTYGFPVDLTADMARERNLSVDMIGFEACMQAQRERARAASQFKMDYHQSAQIQCQTQFVGYESLFESAEVEQMLKDGDAVEILQEGEKGIVVLEVTPFYAESGGQVGDKGILSFSGGQFLVEDTQKQGQAFLHFGHVLQGELRLGTLVEATVDAQSRLSAARNHTATHLLHSALKKVLGDHVEQKGSFVGPERLRFDFSHDQPVSRTQWRKIEKIVNDEIAKNIELTIETMTLDEAKAKGAEALFGEKYDETVRVITVGGFSCELCGGTHVKRTGDIGLFKLVAEAGVASGVRRLEALTASPAVEWMQQGDQICFAVAETLKVKRDHISDKLQQTFERLRAAEKQVEALQLKLAQSAGNSLVDQAQEIAGVKVLTSVVQEGNPKTLRELADQLKAKMKSGIVLLALAQEGKMHLVAVVTQDLKGRYLAGKLIQHLAQALNGKGGGRPDMAQGGLPSVHPEDELARVVKAWVEQQGR